MSLIIASLLSLSLAPPSQAEMPADFLQVDSPAWNKWLDEEANTAWGGVSLKSALAGAFGAADFAVDDAKALETRIKFDARDLSRRATLWQLSQKYGFTIRWAQQGEPKMFMGVSEAEHRERNIGGRTMTVVTQVMRSDYKDYLDLRQRGQIAKEEMLDGLLYYATNVDRDLNLGYATAHYDESQRYKTTVPPKEVRIEARFTAKVHWIEAIGRREAKVVSVGVDPRWLVGIEILSIGQASAGFEKKGAVVLAIHSPARVFSAYGEDLPDKVYEFKITGSLRKGRAGYYYAEAKEKEEPPKLSLVQVEANVIRFIPQALREYHEDGGWAIFDAVEFKITSPPKWRGTKLLVYCNPGQKNPVFRSAGAKCRFKIKEVYLIGPSRDTETGVVTTHQPFDADLEEFQKIK